MGKAKLTFTANTVIIILALLSSILLWYYGYNSNDPIETLEYKLFLKLRNVDKLKQADKFLANIQSLEGSPINIKITTSRKIHSELKRDDENGFIVAYIDFSVSHLLNAQTDEVWTNVEIDLPNKYDNPNYRVDIINRDPLTKLIQFDKIEEKTFRVIAMTTLDLPDNFSYTTPVANPPQVTITGPSVDLNRINSVIVSVNPPNIDVTSPGAPNSYTLTGELRAHDSRGAVINSENIDFNGVTEISVSYNILKSKKIPVIAPTYTGEPAKGYALNPTNPTYSYEPSEVEIKGPKEEVDAATRIKLEPIDISDKTDKSEFQPFNLRNILSEIGKNLELVDVNNDLLTVVPYIERVDSNEYRFSNSFVERIGYDSEKMQISGGSFTIVVEAVQSFIDKFSIYDHVSASIDLSSLANMPPGEYEVPVKLEIQEGYKVISDQPHIKVVIKSIAASPESKDSVNQDIESGNKKTGGSGGEEHMVTGLDNSVSLYMSKFIKI